MSFMPESYIAGSEKEMEEIMKDAQVLLQERYNIKINEPKAIYCMVIAALDAAAKHLGKNVGDSINFGNRVTMYSTNTESETGEKGGNIVIGFEVGEYVKLRGKDDDLTEDDEEE